MLIDDRVLVRLPRAHPNPPFNRSDLDFPVADLASVSSLKNRVHCGFFLLVGDNDFKLDLDAARDRAEIIAAEITANASWKTMSMTFA